MLFVVTRWQLWEFFPQKFLDTREKRIRRRFWNFKIGKSSITRSFLQNLTLSQNFKVKGFFKGMRNELENMEMRLALIKKKRSTENWNEQFFIQIWSQIFVKKSPEISGLGSARAVSYGGFYRSSRKKIRGDSYRTKLLNFCWFWVQCQFFSRTFFSLKKNGIFLATSVLLFQVISQNVKDVQNVSKCLKNVSKDLENVPKRL